jgi:hypothetical protein
MLALDGDGDGELGEVGVADDLAELALASSISAAVQRRHMSPLNQCLALRSTRRTVRSSIRTGSSKRACAAGRARRAGWRSAFPPRPRVARRRGRALIRTVVLVCADAIAGIAATAAMLSRTAPSSRENLVIHSYSEIGDSSSATAPALEAGFRGRGLASDIPLSDRPIPTPASDRRHRADAVEQTRTWFYSTMRALSLALRAVHTLAQAARLGRRPGAQAETPASRQRSSPGAPLDAPARC